MYQEIGSRIVKNSLLNAARATITIPVTLILLPFIINHLGKEEYGIWALVGVITSYTQLSDFGVTESLIKFIAEHKARENAEELNLIVNTALSAYVVLSMIFCSLFILLLPFITDNILNIAPFFRAKAMHVFTVAIIVFFANMLLSVFSSLLVGFQRMEYSNGIAIVSLLFTACGTVFVIKNGYGLTGLIYNTAVAAPLTGLANVIIAKRLFPAMRINPFRYFSWKSLGTIAGFSWKVQVSSIMQLLVFQVDRVILSHYLGLASVGLYDVANQIAYQARNVIVFIFSPVIPAASTLQASKREDTIPGLYTRSFKYMSLAAIPFSLLVIALAHPFMRTWMGEGYEISAWTLQILMTAYLVNLLTGPGAFILSGINRPDINMFSSLLAGVTNLVLCLVLVQQTGYYGVPLGIFASILASGGFFLWLVHHTIRGITIGFYVRTLLRPLLSALLLGLGIGIIDGRIRLQGFASLVLISMLYLIFFAFLTSRGSYLDKFDRDLLSDLTPYRRQHDKK